MTKVKIFTDSLSDLPPTVIEQYEIGIAPVYVVFSNELIFRHTVDITTEEIYTYVREKGTIPGIAAPTPHDLSTLFAPCIAAGDNVLFISMASGLSPTYKNAVAAAQQFPEGRVTVIDSTSISSGTAMMVLRAVTAARKRRHPATITKELHHSRTNLEEEMLLDKLNFINQGGNVYGLHNRIKSPLNLKSPATVRSGRMHFSMNEPQGGVTKALDKMLYNALDNKDEIDQKLVLISQTMAEQPAEYLREALINKVGCDEVLVTSSISGFLSRTSPRSLGVSYYRRADQG
ncbi:DegV family protein [Paenibacillus sp. FSL L8-0463]|uniref:DegV family protein n=1 Tax=Paenibacillus sp. FSL L8-0463 TaxID=2954687 RepID=UPI00311958BE